MQSKHWHTITQAELLETLETTKSGLSSADATIRMEKHGPNKLAEGKKKTLPMILAAQFADLMIWILMAAAVISAFMKEWENAAIIGVVVLLNAILGAIQESKAEAALEALKKMAAPMARVMRDGAVNQIPAEKLVPGDIVFLEAGDSVPCDLRLLSCSSLKAEESALTGESVPVEKKLTEDIPPDAPLGDRLNMTYMSTSITYGRGVGVAVGTGMETQMGSIARQLSSTEKEITPLQKKLNQISNVLSIGVLAIAAVILGLEWLMGVTGPELFLKPISLAVAAIPEGMVAVVTIVLALGMSRMAKQGAIIRKLPAVETLGATQIICSDKTGTLTQNRMTVKKIWSDNENILFEAMGYCNDSRLNDLNAPIGDPTETALVDYLLLHEKWTPEQYRANLRAGEIPFDSERKLSTVVMARSSGIYRIYVKGAPDVLLSRCIAESKPTGDVDLSPERRQAIEQENETMASSALRVLAFAYKDTDQLDLSDVYGAESKLTFCGLTGMIDPARPEAKEAIAVCRTAGILPVMITGDHKITAVAIAEDLGILSDGRKAVTGAELELIDEETLDKEVEKIGVYARVAPEHKSRIVNAWQKKGKIVAMTGDGVNDAPALRSADIGVGMGITGTDVSKGASDMVLTDDNFATIVTAVGEGRRIFDNIHKTIRFLLSSNAGEVIAILVSFLLGWPSMLLAIHLLWINLVTDTFPALALGVEPMEPHTMERSPRDARTPFFTGREWFRILLMGAFEAALALTAYVLGGKGIEGTTMAFLTLALSQLFAAVGLQSERRSIFTTHPGKHRMLWLAFFGSAFLQVIVVLAPPLRELFGLSSLNVTSWLIVLGLCLCMLLFTELQKILASFPHGRKNRRVA